MKELSKNFQNSSKKISKAHKKSRKRIDYFQNDIPYCNTLNHLLSTIRIAMILFSRNYFPYKMVEE